MGECLYCLRNGKEDTWGSIVRDPDRVRNGEQDLESHAKHWILFCELWEILEGFESSHSTI